MPSADAHSRASSARTTRRALYLFLVLGLATPAHAQFHIAESEAGDITLGAVLQPRYAYTSLPGESESEFSFRRAWLDLRGQLAHPDLSFRFQPDFGGTVTMRDVWAEYNLTESWGLRLGQYTVPFALPRDIGGPNRTFTELSRAANNMQVPQGRDVGVGLGGSGERWSLSMGVFDGRGRLDRRGSDRPSTSGVLGSVRGAFAVIGAVPRHNNTQGQLAAPTVAVGAGAQGAARNHLRDWSLGGTPDVEHQRADWYTGTVDAVVKGGPFAGSVALFQRHVDPDNFRSYRDQGGELELALAIPAVSVEIAARGATLKRDVNERLDHFDDSDEWQTEWGAALNLYHDGHNNKTQLTWTSRDDANADWEVHLQHQIRF